MKRLLAIDKDIDTLNMINYHAHEFDLEVYTSIDRLTAWEIESLQPDIVFIDCVFNSKDGEFVCAQLKANNRNKNLRIAVMSSIAEYENVLKQQNADSYLRKPLDKHVLIKTLHRFID